MAQVVQFAKLSGWLVYHTHDSRRSPEGFPDLVLVRGPRLVVAELKSETGVLSPAQKEWISALSRTAETYVWRPSDWPEIEETLRRGA